MKKLFSFLLIVVLIACSKDVEEPVLFTLTATANPTEGGTVSPTNGQYESGDVATVTATPNAEYVFEKWTGGATGTSSSVSVTMNGNKSVVANFIKKQYPLTIEIEGEGTVTETVIKQGLATDYNSGTIVELTAEPTGDWEFVEWSGDITSTENPVQITIDGPKTVKARFRNIIEVKTYKWNLDNPYNNQKQLLQTFSDTSGIFYFTENENEYIIVPGVSDGLTEILGNDSKNNIPRSLAYVMKKVDDEWTEPTKQDDITKTWSARNYDINEELFVFSDANEIELDNSLWSGDLIMGKPSNGVIDWIVVNEPENREFNHDVTLGDYNGDGITDVIGTMWSFFKGNGNDTFTYEDPSNLIDYRWNNPLTFEMYDFDDDGIDEIISADYVEPFLTDASNRLTIHKRESAQEKFIEIFSESSGSVFFDFDMAATSIQINDFNNDGIMDISIAREGNQKRSFEIWIGKGELVFEPHFSKIFESSEFNFQEFVVFDANNDGNLDILLRANNNGGQATSEFHNTSVFEDGFKLNKAIWLNNGDATFNYYDLKNLKSDEPAYYASPYKDLNGNLHYFGFYSATEKYNQSTNKMELSFFDVQINF